MLGVCIGLHADTDKFMAVAEIESANADASDASDTVDEEKNMPPPHPCGKYMEIKQYLTMKGKLDKAEEQFGDLCEGYIVCSENNTLWNKRRDMRYVAEPEELKDIIKKVHLDLRHCGKMAIEKVVRQRFEVASDI